MGYHRAGFTEIVGVDIKPQPRYPFTFHQADAMTFPLEGFDVIHASPPCERYSQLTPNAFRRNHDDLIDAIRERLILCGVPYVIENVPSAKRRLRHPFMLCGSMFGLGVQRHRFFECSSPTNQLVQNCAHLKAPCLISGTHRRTWEPRYEYTVAQCREASGIDWMIRTELDKAIPPAYTEFIGKQLLDSLRA